MIWVLIVGVVIRGDSTCTGNEVHIHVFFLMFLQCMSFFFLVFCFFYAIDGVLRERGFEILAVPVAIAVVTVYIIGNYIYKSDELEDGVRIVRVNF